MEFQQLIPQESANNPFAVSILLSVKVADIKKHLMPLLLVLVTARNERNIGDKI